MINKISHLKFCGKCGFENPDGFSFCGKCGESLAPEPQSEGAVVNRDRAKSAMDYQGVDFKEITKLADG